MTGWKVFRLEPSRSWWDRVNGVYRCLGCDEPVRDCCCPNDFLRTH